MQLNYAHSGAHAPDERKATCQVLAEDDSPRGDESTQGHAIRSGNRVFKQHLALVTDEDMKLYLRRIRTIALVENGRKLHGERPDAEPLAKVQAGLLRLCDQNDTSRKIWRRALSVSLFGFDSLINNSSKFQWRCAHRFSASTSPTSIGSGRPHGPQFPARSASPGASRII